MAYEGIKSIPHLSGKKKRKRERRGPFEIVTYLLRKRQTKVEREWKVLMKLEELNKGSSIQGGKCDLQHHHHFGSKPN